MKRFSLLILLSVIASFAFADSFSVSKQEQKNMYEEAEDWIDDMPDGIQDRMSDAVSHAMRGFFKELEYFRSVSDTTGISKYPVIVKNIPGGGNHNIPMRLYKGKNVKGSSPLPLLIYFHGGGWSMGSLDTSEKFCRALASKGNVIIISVSYPLAPEYPYPSALNLCSSAVNYIYEKASEWGSSKNLVSLGGDGAGGNIALTVNEKLPQNIKIKSIVLYYPLLKTSGTLNYQTRKEFGRGYGFDSRLWEAYIEAYNNKTSSGYKKMPEILLISAGRDIVIAEAKEFSKNNNVTSVIFEGALHGFLTDGHQKTAFEKAVVITDQFLISGK